MRLLLVMDARLHLADKDGCTPLHWAAIKGAGEACQVLLQGGAGSLLTTEDVTGSTPPQLAAQKGHRCVPRQQSTAVVSTHDSMQYKHHPASVRRRRSHKRTGWQHRGHLML